jgi:hypothetical protein
MTTTHEFDTAPTSSWDLVHTRSTSLREVVALLDAGRSLPHSAAGFADEDELLTALQGVWSRRLNGRIDLALETDDHDLAVSVGHAWTLTAVDLPGVRRVLDEHAGRPSLQPHFRIEHRTVAVAAGLATFDDPGSVSARIGARFVATLRRRPNSVETHTGWWRRLTA